MAEDEGFEPPQTESESGVLPLHKSSIAGTFLIIRTFLEMSRSFLKIFEISGENSMTAELLSIHRKCTTIREIATPVTSVTGSQ